MPELRNSAVEIRSPEEYGPVAEKALAAKRAEYLEAGTLVVWDVDLEAETITSYRADGSSRVYVAGDHADAEPGLQGWRWTWWRCWVSLRFATIPVDKYRLRERCCREMQVSCILRYLVVLPFWHQVNTA